MATQQGGSQSSVSPEGISAIVGIPDEPVQDISAIVGIPDNAVAHGSVAERVAGTPG